MKENEILLYRTNKAPSMLAMLFLVFNTCQTIFTLNAVDPSAAGIRIMEIILVNILLSFLVFISSSQIKLYSIKWSYAALFIGVFQCSRYFFMPSGTQHLLLTIVIPQFAAGVILIASSVWSINQCSKYRMAKKELV